MARKTILIKGDPARPYSLATARADYLLGETRHRVLADDTAQAALTVELAARAVRLDLQGTVSAPGAGKEALRILGPQAKVTIAETAILEGAVAIHAFDTVKRVSVSNAGTVSGQTGLQIDGGTTRAIIANAGDIAGTKTGVTVSGDYSRLVNSGLIEATGAADPAASAVEAAGRFSRILNKAGGELSGPVGLSSGAGHAGETVLVRNAGEIAGSIAAIRSTDANLVFVNTGSISGNILLGSGDDTLDLRRGTVSASQISGGAGDDIYRLAATRHILTEAIDGGNDTVRVSVTVAGDSYTLPDNIENLALAGRLAASGTGNALGNQLDGGVGRNTLSGLAGNVILDGGRGRDTLTGGADADTFVFIRKGGRDVVTDFDPGLDHVELQGFRARFDSLEEILAVARDTDAGVLLAFGKGAKLLLHDVTISDLDADSFTWF